MTQPTPAGALDGLRRTGDVARRRLPALVRPALWVLVILAIGWLLTLAAGGGSGAYVVDILPTAIGVVAGIPFAVWILRLDDELDAVKAAEEASTRKRLVLDVLGRELRDNLAELQGERAERPRPDIVPLLRDDTWRALSDGAELGSIKDPELVGRLARAYHRIGTTTLLERRILELKSDPLWRTTGWQTIPEFDPMPPLRAMVADQDRHTIAAVEHALASIDASQVTTGP